MYKTQVDTTVATNEVAGRRQELKAQNREKLLAAARKVFAEKGLGAATARDIVRETDLASGTFYNYFDDKNDAFRALIELFVDMAEWTDAGDLPPLDLDYLATAMVGAGFQVANHLLDREPADVDAAARFCTRLFMGGIPALVSD
jgi:AcrR family transcriptional regulator